jgi:glycosyltransferase involved in cell wall biosynthesis
MGSIPRVNCNRCNHGNVSVKTRLTVAHVLSSFEVGGGERVAVDLAHGQVARGHRVLAISLAPAPDGPHWASFEQAGAAPMRVDKRGPTFDPSLPLRLLRTFRDEGVDVVHTHNPLPVIYAAPAGRLAGAAVVHTKHGLNAASSRRMWLRRAGARFVDRMVAVSAETAADARAQRDVGPARLGVIANGIRLDAYAPNAALRREVRDELGIPAAAWVVGTVGRLHPLKNHAHLIRAAAPLLGDGARLVIVGDGELAGALAAQVRALPAGAHVHLLGRRMDVARLMAAFDVFAMSSTSEGLPLVIPEAMAAGLPVVSTAVGGIPEVIDDGVTGYLVASGDEAALRARLAELAAEPVRAREMGTRARARALATYSADRMVEAYLRVYAEALERRS